MRTSNLYRIIIPEMSIIFRVDPLIGCTEYIPYFFQMFVVCHMWAMLFPCLCYMSWVACAYCVAQTLHHYRNLSEIKHCQLERNLQSTSAITAISNSDYFDCGTKQRIKCEPVDLATIDGESHYGSKLQVALKQLIVVELHW